MSTAGPASGMITASPVAVAGIVGMSWAQYDIVGIVRRDVAFHVP